MEIMKTKQTLRLSDITKGSFIYNMAKATIKYRDEFICNYKGIPTKIIA